MRVGGGGRAVLRGVRSHVERPIHAGGVGEHGDERGSIRGPVHPRGAADADAAEATGAQVLPRAPRRALVSAEQPRRSRQFQPAARAAGASGRGELDARAHGARLRLARVRVVRGANARIRHRVPRFSRPGGSRGRLQRGLDSRARPSRRRRRLARRGGDCQMAQDRVAERQLLRVHVRGVRFAVVRGRQSGVRVGHDIFVVLVDDGAEDGVLVRHASGAGRRW